MRWTAVEVRDVGNRLISLLWPRIGSRICANSKHSYTKTLSALAALKQLFCIWCVILWIDLPQLQRYEQVLEEYLAERAENTEMVIFDRYFTFSLPGVHHIHLQLNLRDTVELTSPSEGWDHKTPSATCQPLLASAQGPLAPSFLGEQCLASARDEWGQRAKGNASCALVSHPALQEKQQHSAPNYPQIIIKCFVSFFPSPPPFFKGFSFPSIFSLTVTFSCSTGKHSFIVWINFQTD